MICARYALSRSIRPLALLLLSAAATIVVPGCGSSHPSVRLEPINGYIVYNQAFTTAWCRQGADGGYDLVLVDQPEPGSSRSGQPLRSVGGIDVPRQVLHVRVAWRPASGAKANYPAATNATFNWYVIDDQNPADIRYLHYQGAGLVKVYPDDETTEFAIQPTPLSLRHRKGTLNDPIGSAVISGQFDAKNSAVKTTDVLQNLDEVFRLAVPEAQPSAATEPSGTPPARTNVGP